MLTTLQRATRRPHAFIALLSQDCVATPQAWAQAAQSIQAIIVTLLELQMWAVGLPAQGPGELALRLCV